MNTGLADATTGNRIASGLGLRNPGEINTILGIANISVNNGAQLDNIWFSEGANLVNPIPEPSSPLLIAGGAMLGLARRRRPG